MTYEIVYEAITDNLNKDYTINMNEHCIVDNNNNVQKFLIHGEFITLISNNTSTTIKLVDLHINYKYAKLKRSYNTEIYNTKYSLDEYILNEYNINVSEDMDYDTFIILSSELLELIQNKSIKLNKYTEDDVSIEFILSNNNKFFVFIKNYNVYDGYNYYTYLPIDVLVSTISNTVVCKYINTNVTELVIKHQNKV